MNIVRINQENYPQFDAMIEWRHTGIEPQPTPSSLTQDIINELNNPNLYLYGLEIEHHFIGWISLVYIPKVSKFKGHGHIYVDELWIEPSFQNHGYAKILMKKADELKEKLNATGIRLYVNTDNPIAHHLYQTCGFQDEGNAIFMEK